MNLTCECLQCIFPPVLDEITHSSRNLLSGAGNLYLYIDNKLVCTLEVFLGHHDYVVKNLRSWKVKKLAVKG